ncbi:MAG: LytR C-terminal domain-containing protein [Candidatus Levybacteria bacterium]|nr:LytR C-terminal domain-containing protein [Candidatus Levybacteria bacterium]
MKKAARKKKETMVENVAEQVVEALIPEVQEQKKVKKLFSNKPFLISSIFVLLIIIGATGFFAFLYFQKDAPQNSKNSQLNSGEIEALVKEVGEKVALPVGEVPTIATVSDIEKLAGQPFFKNAQNGDKVLIYASTKEAILYRPSIGKVISMAPVNNPEAAVPTPSLEPNVNASATPSLDPSVVPADTKIKVAVLNSTKEAGLAKKGAALLDKNKYEVVSTSNAQGEYAETTVSQIDKSKVKDADLKSIIASFSKIKASAKSLPTGEATPAGADAVIILGSDFSEAY